VRLESSEGKIFEVEEAAAVQSVFIKKFVEDIGRKNPIHLDYVSTEILEKVIEYCTYHVDHPPRPMETADDVDQWDVEFLMNVDKPTLFQLAQAAHFLVIKSLLDLVCRTIADAIIACKTPEKVREMLHIQNDFTPEEEQKIRLENQWAFDE